METNRIPNPKKVNQFAHVTRLPQYQKLSEANKKRVLRALKQGRAYLSGKTNGTDKTGGVHYTRRHNGKMRDLISISTSVLDNPICCSRMLDRDSICAHCFAVAQMTCYKEMQPCYKRNLDILSQHLLEDEEIPVILPKSGQLRGESFGDVCNVIQAANYLRIAAANPWTNFAVWTKNPAFYHAAIVGGYAEKPKNCNIILSSRYVNKVDEVPTKYAYFIDRVFTVYDDNGIERQGVKINCGALSCATCRKCYTKTDKFYLINEKLK